jgi:glutaredoxin
MSEPLVRVILVVGIVLAAAAIARIAFILRAHRAAAARVDVSGLTGRVILFTESSCPTCTAARSALEASGVPYEEVSYSERPDELRAAGVEAVPLIVVRDPAGAVIGQMAGKPSEKALERLLRDVPRK